MEASNCDLCEREMSKPFIKYDFQAFPCCVSICMNCGLVKLNPRWKESQYRRFYSKKYDFFYRGSNMSVDELFEIDIASKGLRMTDRLRYAELPEKVKMLDIGAGTGFSFFSLPGNIHVAPYAVEASNKCIPFLKSKGISIIGDDFSSDLGGGYDLIVARHVLEHVMNPISFLMKISNSLRKNGYLYLAVPNAMVINKIKAHSFFRHIHTYYFNIGTLLQMCKRAGMYAVQQGEEGEIWALLQRKETNNTIRSVSSSDQLKTIMDITRYHRFSLKSRLKARLRRIRYCAF